MRRAQHLFDWCDVHVGARRKDSPPKDTLKKSLRKLGDHCGVMKRYKQHPYIPATVKPMINDPLVL
jgi:hypothetical protein